MDNPVRGGRGHNYNTRGRGGRGSQYYNRNKQNSFRNNPDYRQRQSESENVQSNEVQETAELTDTSQRSYHGRNNSETQIQEHRVRGNRGGVRRPQSGRRRQSASSDTRPYQETNRRRSESQSSSSSSKVTNNKVDLKLITPSSEEEENQMLILALEESKKTADTRKAFYDEISQVEKESFVSDGEESSSFDAVEEARKIKSLYDFPPLPTSEINEVVLELLPETNGTQSGNVQSDTILVSSGVEQSGKDWTLYGAKPKGTVSVARVPAGRGAMRTTDDSSPQIGSFLSSKGNISAPVHQKITEKHLEDSKPISVIKKVVSKSSVEEKVPNVFTNDVETLGTKENAMVESLTEQLKETNIDSASDSMPDSISTIVTTYPTDVLVTTATEIRSMVTDNSQREDMSVIRPQSSPLLETPTDLSRIGIDSNAVTRLHQTEYSLEMVARSEQNMLAQNKSSDDEEQRCVELELKSTDSMEQIVSQNTQPPAGISQIIVPFPAMYQYPGIVYQIGFPSPYFPHMKPAAMFPYQNASPTVISTPDGQLIPTAPIPQHLPIDYGGFIPRFIAPGQTLEPTPPPPPPPPMENNVDQLQTDYQSLIVSKSQLSVNAVPFSPRETPRTHAPSLYYTKPKGNRGGHYGPGHQRNYNTGYHNPRNGYGNHHRPPHRHPFPSRNYQDYSMNPLQHSEIQTQDVPNENPQFYGGANFYQCNPYQRQDFR